LELGTPVRIWAGLFLLWTGFSPQRTALVLDLQKQSIQNMLKKKHIRILKQLQQKSHVKKVTQIVIGLLGVSATVLIYTEGFGVFNNEWLVLCTIVVFLIYTVHNHFSNVSRILKRRNAKIMAPLEHIPEISSLKPHLNQVGVSFVYKDIKVEY